MVLQWSSDGATARESRGLNSQMAESTADKFYPVQHRSISLTCRLSRMLHLFQVDMVDIGAACRRRDRRLRAFWRHEHLSMTMVLATAMHHSAG